MVRHAGHPWTVIGEYRAISRQAARQRSADRVEETPPTVGLIRGRGLEAALDAALEAAEADHVAEAGTEHLLRGLLTDGVAAATLEQLGVTRDTIREASRRLFVHPDAAAPVANAVFSGEAHAAPAFAEHLAMERTPACAPVVVATPQPLAVIATNPGSRGRRVLNDFGADVADLKRLSHCHINLPRSGSGRAVSSAGTRTAISAVWWPARTGGSAPTASAWSRTFCASRPAPLRVPDHTRSGTGSAAERRQPVDHEVLAQPTALHGIATTSGRTGWYSDAPRVSPALAEAATGSRVLRAGRGEPTGEFGAPRWPAGWCGRSDAGLRPRHPEVLVTPGFLAATRRPGCAVAR
jgi:hypothetical protein